MDRTTSTTSTTASTTAASTETRAPTSTGLGMPRIDTQLRFEGAFAFRDAPWLKLTDQEPIVYRLRVLANGGRAFRRIRRATGVDDLGVLGIGESGRGRSRLRDFWKAAAGEARSHRAGRDFAWYEFGEVFGLDLLRVEFVRLGSKDLAEAVEAALIEEYRSDFKDRPPLNGSSGKVRKVVRWLEGLGRRARDDDGWLDLSGLLP